jgi:nucleotide-binding universal stress UspA family protein
VSLVRAVRDPNQLPAAEQYLAGIAERLVRKGLAVVGRHALVGSAADAIEDLAHEGQLVVMATHAHAPLTHWFTSSVADRVLHRQATAVLLVRAGAAAAGSLHVVPAKAARGA